MATWVTLLFVCTLLSAARSLSGGDNYCKGLDPGLFYDADTDKCLGLLWTFIGLPLPKEIGTLACPKNAEVELSSDAVMCSCRKAFFPLKELKSCMATKRIGEACGRDLGLDGLCDILNSVVCSAANGTSVCQCETGKVWIPVDETCKALAGRSCSANSQCVQNSECRRSQSEEGRPSCDCKMGYVAGPDGFCYLGHGTPCLPNQCVPGTRCSNGICQCADPLIEAYDGGLKACRRLAGASCLTTDFCTEESECTDGVCKCSFGHKRAHSGICTEARDLGQNCTQLQCDAAEGLACMDGSCACFSSSLTFVVGKGCLAGLGLPCGEYEDLSIGKKYIVPCVDNAYCKHASKLCVPKEVFYLNGTRLDAEAAYYRYET